MKRFTLFISIIFVCLLYETSNAQKIGDQYIDIEAPELIKGNTIKLSNQIKGKYALLFLWSYWCSDCRRYSKSIIPIVEKYQGQKFTVIGIASENKSNKNSIKTVKELKYPWINLIDLNQEIDVWKKYNVNAGGSSFLIDPSGKIIDITPSAKKLQQILSQL